MEYIFVYIYIYIYIYEWYKEYIYMNNIRKGIYIWMIGSLCSTAENGTTL